MSCLSKNHVSERMTLVVYFVLLVAEISFGQCTTNITQPTVSSIDVGAGETVCVNEHVEVTGSITVAAGGTLVLATSRRLSTVSLTSQGNIQLGDHSFLYVQTGVNLEGDSSVTSLGRSSTFLVCNGLNVVFGAQIQMSTLSTLDCINGNFLHTAAPYPYIVYVGTPGADPQAQFIGRNMVVVAGFLSNSNMVGYCAADSAAELTIPQLGNAVNFCSPFIPPPLLASDDCDSIAEYYEVIILPVVFRSVNVETHDGFNRIDWTTDNPENINHFIVERQAANAVYQQAGQVNAYLDRRTYTFDDAALSPVYGNVNYRIRAITKHGSMYFSMVKRARSSGSSLLKIWPNPASGSFNISLPPHAEADTRASIRITNVFGYTVHHSRCGVTGRVIHVPPAACTSLPPGVYYAYVQVAGKTYAVKWIKS